MMVKIIKIGKIKRKSIASETDFFVDRINKFSKIEIESVSESKFKSKDRIIKDESERLISKLKHTDYSVCLDRNGKRMDSVKFSNKMNDLICHGKRPTFIIGGAYGTSEELKDKVDLRLSFSDFTMQHDIILIALLEQIYRAYTILKGYPYHK